MGGKCFKELKVLAGECLVYVPVCVRLSVEDIVDVVVAPTLNIVDIGPLEIRFIFFSFLREKGVLAP